MARAAQAAIRCASIHFSRFKDSFNQQMQSLRQRLTALEGYIYKAPSLMEILNNVIVAASIAETPKPHTLRTLMPKDLHWNETFSLVRSMHHALSECQNGFEHIGHGYEMLMQLHNSPLQLVGIVRCMEEKSALALGVIKKGITGKHICTHCHRHKQDTWGHLRDWWLRQQALDKHCSSWNHIAITTFSRTSSTVSRLYYTKYLAMPAP